MVSLDRTRGIAFGRRGARMYFYALAAVVLAALTTGCAGTGASNTELSAVPATSSAPIAPAGSAATGQARLTLTRVQALLYVGAPATVKINGQKVADIGSGSSSVQTIAPGPNTITVEAWSYPGTWTVNLDAKPGQNYAIEISPRGDSYAPSLLGPVGGAIDSANSKNAGAFQMRVL